ncbi:protocadherin Fat 4-like isoform X2 [Dendronephthya gigantea]|uniref:protocadherin Fat 4-like isoform X2 n=1 Tax=Dendronephthya gigantea TaxID=151771 RepID=UPI00106CF913|nr:protocadherin Fat 4-like isoform X2 [Dendronephthya gigantea]
MTGEITTNVILDRETRSHFILKVIAKDGDLVDPKSNSTLVHINITDVNDNSPKFTKSRVTISVKEDVPLGYSVANITAVDPDEGLNGEVYYSIPDGNTDAYFVFNNLTGELKTNKLLDRENTDRYLLVIQAYDRGSPSSSSLAFVTILVDDINDNAPVITTTSYTSTVMENSPAGQLVCKVSATDRDIGANQLVSYSLNYAEFAVNSSGFVYTTRSLDRENVAEYDIKIVATDQGTPSKSSSVTVKLKVGDSNDNYPVFDESLYAVLISENMTVGSEVIRVTATDLDAGVNSELTYALTGGQGYFTINRTTGLITMVTPVDHESNPGGFVVHVTASDRGIPDEKSTKVQVNIGISNVNDNIPVFEQYGYFVSLNESTASGTLVVRVLATDRDEGLLGEVTYSIIDGNFGDAFSMNNSGFLVVSNNLDRETKEFYELTVKATDKAGIPKSAVTSVNIHVLDINDNPPMIVNAPVELEVNESTPVDTVLFTLVATDPDLGETNQKVTFESVLSDGFLKVDSDTGAVTLSQKLVHASQQRHVLRVLPADHGRPALRGSAVNVSVIVIPKDSNDPVFEHPAYAFNISETTRIDTLIGTVQAFQRNKTSGSSIVYEITSGNSEKTFHINKSLGTLTLLKTLNRDNQFYYTLVVTATNNQNLDQVGRTVVTILITDANNSPPLFQFKNYRAEVKEDASVLTSVIVLEAFDPDEKIITKLQYKIVDGNEDGKFEIATKDVDGINVAEISVSGGLDRELTEYYTLTISVSDGELESNCTLQIRVEDVNDNDPIFNPTSYAASVPENSVAGSPILKVTASDEDLDENADITFAITSTQVYFTIDPKSGEITTTAEKLDRETKSSYGFQVSATDIDGRKSEANVLITVSDENDNTPIFNPLSYETTITEGPDSRGKSVVTVAATDKDEGVNKEIVYSITRGNIGDTFTINNKTGEITVANEVDREIQGLGTNTRGHKAFSLTVMASDLGNKPLASTTEVAIQVNDINDNLPIFPDSGYSFMISHDAEKDMVVIVVTATDEDSGENGRVKYEILEGNSGWAGDFTISGSDGVIKTANKLNRNLGYEYNLTIKASDHGTPSLSATTNVVLTVGPINQHTPVLNPVNYTANVYENNLPKTPLLNITATDADEGQNGQLSYSIVDGNNQSMFDLKSQSSYGTLILAGRLDREHQDQFVLEIMVKDGGIPLSRMATGFVVVNVLDLNDIAPQFREKNYTGWLMENSGSDVSVQMDQTISATDSDLGINAEIIYSISGPGSEQFVIDRATAVLKTRVSPSPNLDYEATPSLTFNVIATDQAGNGLQSMVPITIHLIDENDNSPEFSPVITHVDIPESTAPDEVIATLHATDPDPGINGRVRYSIISGAEGMFEIDKENGTLRVLHGLDRERRDRYQINVSALDGNLNPRQGFGQVVLTLLDTNDNRPMFDELAYTTSVSESIPIGYDVITVHANDVDLGSNSNVSYYLEHKVFNVHNTTGVLRTISKLDRETVGSYSFKVYARDTWGLESNVTVNILVDDVNDNAPYFPKSDVYRSDVSEETPVGTEVLKIVAKDEDWGKNAEIHYSLARNIRDRFIIDPDTGILRLQNSVNKTLLVNQGTINSTGLMELVVRAQDGGNPSLSSEQKIVLRVTDSSDGTPMFGRSVYLFNVSQTAAIGDKVGDVLAVSKSGSDSLTYSFKSTQTYFAIDGNSGKISIAKSLNDVDEEYHIFTVRAVDSRSKTGFTSVVVKFLGTNKHSPEFQFTSPYKMSVSEGVSPGAGVGKMEARDKDWGENGVVTYRFLEANVGENGEMVAVNNSCFLPLGLESLAVTASNMTANSTFSKSNENYNPTQGRLNNQPSTHAAVSYQGAWCAKTTDFRPFLQVDFVGLKKITRVATQGRPRGTSYVTKYTLSYSLNGDTWTSHDQIFAGNTDSESVVVQRILPSFQARYVRLLVLDSNEQACLRLEYYGCNSDGGDEVSIPFFIDENTGEVNVSNKLDRETQEKYVIKVEASDKGTPILADDTILDIYVVDYNDNTPLFEKPAYRVSLSEYTFPGDTVIRVSANDPDQGLNGELKYKLVAGGRGKFSIEESTGLIQPLSRLDYEDPSERHFILNISASDHGTPPLSSYVSVYINVTDFNDNYPEFIASSLTSEVKENLDSGTLITTVKATDADSGNNSLIRYALLEISDKFSIDSTSGEVRTKQRLDREEIGNYVVDIRATDMGNSQLSTDGKLSIKVLDENDNSPEFTEDIYTRKIQEDSAIGAIVVTMKAEDKDIGLNGKVFYTITEGNEKGLFQLSNTSGIVTVAKSLDREVNHTARFTVKAQDQTAPFNSDHADVIVMVTDVNDNAPVIEPEKMTAVISEDVTIGTFIADVNATDRDSSSNAQLEYSIVHGSEGHFSIDPVSGIVTTAVKLDYESKRDYIVLVMVRDKGAIGYLDFGSIEITLTDVNDNAPVFGVPTGPFNILENKAKGSVVGQIQASDADTTLNSKINFTITGGDRNRHFVIDSSSGVISTTEVLDREKTSFYDVIVTASNSLASPILSTNATVRINVGDENDNPPEFNASSYQGQVSENATIGTVVGRVFAKDTDKDDAGVVKYVIVSGEYSRIVGIDSHTGILTLSQSLIENEYRNLSLVVNATDNGDPQMFSTVPVLIIVDDVNDNSPRFDKRQYSASVSEMAKVDDAVVQMIATDNDTTDSGATTYELVSGNELDHFNISSQTGWIYVSKPLDRETMAEYRLGVRASNLVQQKRRKRRRRREAIFSDTVELVVSIDDVNDNIPVFSPLTYVAGVMPGAKDGTLIVSVMATDADSGMNSKLLYNITAGDEKHRFYVNDMGKVLATNVAVGSTGTVYNLNITATDNNGQGSTSLQPANVKIHVISRDQQAMITALVPPDMITNNTDEFINMLNNITDGQAYIDQIKKIKKRNGSGVIVVGSEVIFHVVRNYTILSSDEIISTVNLHRRLLDTLYVKWHIQDVKKIRATADDDDDELEGWEIALIVLGVLLALLILLCCCYYCLICRDRRDFNEEAVESQRKTFFTNSPVYVLKITRQKVDSTSSDSIQFYSSYPNDKEAFKSSLSGTVTNPVYKPDLEDYEEKEMELSLSDEESDNETGKRVSKKSKSFKTRNVRN